MKKIINVLLLIILCITLAGCAIKDKKEQNINIVNYLNCVSKDDTGIRKIMFEYNESDELNKIDFEWNYDWSSKYGGGTDQVYELAEKYVKEDFDSKFEGVDYTYEFFKEGTAIAKTKITRKQVEIGNVKVIDGTDMTEIFKKNKKDMKKYFEHEGIYCTEDNRKNWDIIIFDSLYEFTTIYLDYINENADKLGDVMYSWYALTKDLKVMNVVYMLDEEGFVYSYSDYQVPTLDEEIQRLKEGNTNGINNPTKYFEWLQNIKKNIEEKKTIKEEVIYKEIDYETVEVPDNNKYKGYKEVTQQGQKGVKVITYEVTYDYQDVEISRKKIKEDIHKEPVTEIIKVGTK